SLRSNASPRASRRRDHCLRGRCQRHPGGAATSIELDRLLLCGATPTGPAGPNSVTRVAGQRGLPTSGRCDSFSAYEASTAVYLNVVQLAESLGVEESVIEGWVRNEGLPHVPDRGHLLFDRAQVATWAAQRGLASKVGFLAPEAPRPRPGLRLEPL